MQQILTSRLQNQLLLDHDFRNPEEVVKHMLCMQSQDFNQHLRAIASRCGCSREDIEKTYNNGSIVKGWTQRGTIHCIAAEDFQWMTELCASKTLNGFAKRRAFLGISDQIILHAEEIIRKLLATGPKTRDAISNALKESGIPMQTGRNYHILCHLGTQGIIVQGPIIDGDHAFVLTEQWIRNNNKYNEEQALQELCIRYFTSHGPATLADLQWWSGLGITVLKKGVELAGNKLICRDGLLGRPLVDDFGRTKSASLQPNIHFLAGFDERLLGYKDRTVTLDLDRHTLVDISRNGVFKPTVMIDGKTIGTRTFKLAKKKNNLNIILFPEYKYDTMIDLLKTGILSYEKYCGNEFDIQII